MRTRSRGFTVARATLAAAAAGLTLLATAAVLGIQGAYFANNSYFFDSVYYSFENARLHERMIADGRLAVAWSEWTANPRHPLRTVPLVLMAPSLLAHPLGHLATAVPTLAVFLGVLGWFVFERSHSLAYAGAVMVLFVALPGLYDPVRGLGPYLLDLPAAFLLGSAVLCLLASRGGRDLRWLAGFGALAGLAALSRFASALYAMAIGAPILAGFLVSRWKAERHVLGVLRVAGVVGISVALIAGPYVLTHLSTNVAFYRTFGYAVGRGVAPAAVAAGESLLRFVSIPAAAALVLLMAVQASTFQHICRNPRRGLASVMPAVWAAAAVLVVQIFVLRVGPHAQATLYAVPGLFVLAASPARWPVARRARLARLLTPLTLTSALIVGGAGVPRHVATAQHRSPDKALDVHLAQHLVEGGRGRVWGAFFDEYAWIASVEAFYRYRVLPVPGGQDGFFTVQESAWRGSHPGLAPADVAARVYERACRWLDLAVAFEDPAAAASRFDNDYSREVARVISTRLARDARWERAFTIRRTRYGTLAGYRNRGITPPNPAYARRLRGEPLD